MNKKLRVVTLFYLVSLYHFGNDLNAQNQHKIDSLKASISVENNKEKQVDNYNSIADLFSLDQTDSAFFYAKKGLTLAEHLNYIMGEADSQFQLSCYYDRDGKTNQAITHMVKACNLYAATGDSSYLIGCYNNLGVYYSYGNEQKKSLEYFLKALNLAEKLNETYSLSEAYYNIGTFYEYINENRLALQYYEKALVIDTALNNYENISWSYLNLGNINMKLHRSDDAFDNLVKARETLTDIKDQYSNIQLNINFAYYFLLKEIPDSANVYIEKAKKIYQKNKFERLEADIIAVEANLFLVRKQYAQSLKLYDKAIEIYKQQNISDGLYEIYTSKAKAYEKTGSLVKAYLSLQMANQINDEIKLNEIAKILGKFEQKEATKEKLINYRLEQDIIAQKQKTDLLRAHSRFRYALLSIIFLVILIVFAIYLYSIKKRNNKMLEVSLTTTNGQKLLLEKQYQKLEASKKKLNELNATKDKFFSIIAHDLKNPFATVMWLTENILNYEKAKNPDQLNELIQRIYQTASTGHKLLENLLEWSRSQTGNIDFHPEEVSIDEVVNKNIYFFQEILKEKKIKIVTHDLRNHKVFADKNMVNFIVRNVLNNAIKFSFPEGKIELAVSQKGTYYVVHVLDFGIGMNFDTLSKLFKTGQAVKKTGTAGERGTGLGLILCKEFVNKNGGEIWVESTEGKGSRFAFSLPVFS